ncbi:MAG: hypothetical protein L0221_06750 [Chloroflexi bacterium]|nr:hypothetical protein [Chloroflexota bacterium]
MLVLARIGWALIVVAGAGAAYVLSQPPLEIDGRVYGPDLTVPAALLGAGAALVAVVGSGPLGSRLGRVGMALLALGAFAVVAIEPAESSDNPMAALTPTVIAVVAFVSGGIAVAASLVRSRGAVR